MKHCYCIRKYQPERSSFARWRTTYSSIRRISSTPNASCGASALPQRSFTKRCSYSTSNPPRRRVRGSKALFFSTSSRHPALVCRVGSIPDFALYDEQYLTHAQRGGTYDAIFAQAAALFLYLLSSTWWCTNSVAHRHATA